MVRLHPDSPSSPPLCYGALLSAEAVLTTYGCAQRLREAESRSSHLVAVLKDGSVQVLAKIASSSSSYPSLHVVSLRTPVDFSAARRVTPICVLPPVRDDEEVGPFALHALPGRADCPDGVGGVGDAVTCVAPAQVWGCQDAGGGGSGFPLAQRAAHTDRRDSRYYLSGLSMESTPQGCSNTRATWHFLNLTSPQSSVAIASAVKDQVDLSRLPKTTEGVSTSTPTPPACPGAIRECQGRLICEDDEEDIASQSSTSCAILNCEGTRLERHVDAWTAREECEDAFYQEEEEEEMAISFPGTGDHHDKEEEGIGHTTVASASTTTTTTTVSATTSIGVDDDSRMDNSIENGFCNEAGECSCDEGYELELAAEPMRCVVVVANQTEAVEEATGELI